MTITKEEVIDKIEVVEPYSILQVRESTKIIEDGSVISQSFSRKTFHPVDDVSNEDAKIQAVAAAVWTDEVKAAYAAHLASQELH